VLCEVDRSQVDRDVAYPARSVDSSAWDVVLVASYGQVQRDITVAGAEHSIWQNCFGEFLPVFLLDRMDTREFWVYVELTIDVIVPPFDKQLVGSGGFTGVSLRIDVPVGVSWRCCPWTRCL